MGTGWRLRARHRLHEPQRPVDRAADADIVAVLGACRSARDRLVVLLMARAGLRRGEVLGKAGTPAAFPARSMHAFSIAPTAWAAMPPALMRVRARRSPDSRAYARGSRSTTEGASASMTPVSPGLQLDSLYSDQPTSPQSVSRRR